MADKTKIEWCDATFNPWVGCTPVSPACDHCYAESWAKRTGHPELWTGERRRTTASNWSLPLKWDLAAYNAGRRKRVFCASLADVFDNQVPSQWREDLWHLIDACRSLDWLLLTKRPQNIAKMLPPTWGSGWHNVWLGTTVENQEEAERRIPHLLRAPAAVRFLSCEPLLGPIDLDTVPFTLMPGYFGSALRWHHQPYCDRHVAYPTIDWVITGGESGPHARVMAPQWARDLHSQCTRFGIAFFHKQNGEWDVLPSDRHRDKEHIFLTRDWDFVRVGKKQAGRLLDGVEHSEFPTPRTNEKIAPAA